MWHPVVATLRHATRHDAADCSVRNTAAVRDVACPISYVIGHADNVACRLSRACRRVTPGCMVEQRDDCGMLAGDKVVWSHVPRGGYGYVVPVMATFVRRTSIERATIRVSKRDGTVVCRSVLLSNLHKPKRKGGGVLGYEWAELGITRDGRIA